jgi:hypothetical protein
MASRHGSAKINTERYPNHLYFRQFLHPHGSFLDSIRPYHLLRVLTLFRVKLPISRSCHLSSAPLRKWATLHLAPLVTCWGIWPSKRV